MEITKHFFAMETRVYHLLYLSLETFISGKSQPYTYAAYNPPDYLDCKILDGSAVVHFLPTPVSAKTFAE